MSIITLMFSFTEKSLAKGGLTDCEFLNYIGCLYVPQIKTDSDRLIIFIRGRYLEGSNHVPIPYRKGSALQILDSFGLTNLADSFNLPILVVGSSDQGVSLKELENIKIKYKFSNDLKIILAAHSGGHIGLTDTLKKMKENRQLIEKIIMLDNFYEENNENIKILKDVIENGADCWGYITPQNVKAFKQFYAPFKCKIDGPEKMHHTSSAAFCLSYYLQGRSCLSRKD